MTEIEAWVGYLVVKGVEFWLLFFAFCVIRAFIGAAWDDLKGRWT